MSIVNRHVNKYIKRSFSISGILGVRITSQAFLLILLTYVLEPDIYSNFIAVTSLALVLGSFSSLGSGYLMLELNSKNIMDPYTALCKAIPLSLLVGSALFCILIPSSYYVNDALSINTIYLIGIIEIILLPILSLFGSALYADSKIVTSQLFPFVGIFSKLLAVIYCLNTSELQDPFTLTLVQLLFIALSTVLIFSVFANISTFKITFKLPNKEHMIKGSGYGAMHSTTLVANEIDKILIVNWLPSMEASLYSLSNRIVLTAITPCMAIIIAIVPRLYYLANNDSKVLRMVVFITLSASCVFGVFCGVILSVAAPFISLIFNQSYLGIEFFLYLMSPLCVSVALRAGITSIMATLGLVKKRIILELLGIIIFILASSILSRYYDAKGVILSLLFVDMFFCMAGLYIIDKKTKS